MAIDWTTGKSERVQEVVLGAANTFTELRVPDRWGRAVALRVYCSTTDGYYCLTGTDGAVRGTEARMPLAQGWNLIRPFEGTSLYFANVAGSADLRLQGSPCYSNASFPGTAV